MLDIIVLVVKFLDRFTKREMFNLVQSNESAKMSVTGPFDTN